MPLMWNKENVGQYYFEIENGEFVNRGNWTNSRFRDRYPLKGIIAGALVATLGFTALKALAYGLDEIAPIKNFNRVEFVNLAVGLAPAVILPVARTYNNATQEFYNRIRSLYLLSRS